jgi:hypothetical protein
MKWLKVLSATMLAGVAGCSLPMHGSKSIPDVPEVFESANNPDAIVDPPVVQVRTYWRAASVTIIAWDPEDAAFGLRTTVNRSGTLTGGVKFGDHSLYMTPYLVRDMGGFKHAATMKDNVEANVLLATGARRDDYSCFYGKNCSPMVTLGIRLPDSLLRANQEPVVVTFFPPVMTPWTLTIRRQLIDAYLAKVDSVVTDMKRVAAM